MNISKLQLFYLSALSMLGFIATDMYLPAFSSMQSYLSTGPEQLALSLTVFLVGLAIGQLAWGIISDKFGYRNSLIAGLTLFALSSLGLAFSDQVWQLLTFRFVQAIGVCAPAVIWQAMAISRYPAKVSQQLFATIMPLVALSPALAPQLGVVLLNNFGWQSIFIVLTVLGMVLALFSFFQPNNVSPNKNTNTLSDIKELLTSKVYMGNILMFAFSSAAFFAYLTGMPEIMSQLGYSPEDIGLSFLPQTFAFIAGGLLGKKWTKTLGASKVLLTLLIFFSVASLLVFFSSQWELTSIWPLLAPFCLIAMANGALYPIVVSQALANAKNSPATAAGFQNSFQVSVSSLASAIVAAFASYALPITGAVILICMIGLWAGYLLANEKSWSHFTKPDNARVVEESND